MSEPSFGEWPWLVTHDGHPAWYQRAFIIGDFRDDLLPIPNYVMELDGDLLGPGDPVKCGTCRQIPFGRELLVVERSTGNDRFLDSLRNGIRPWPPPTHPNTCWYCNGVMTERVDLRARKIADGLWNKRVKGNGLATCCAQCADFVDLEEYKRGKKPRPERPRNKDPRDLRDPDLKERD